MWKFWFFTHEYTFWRIQWDKRSYAWFEPAFSDILCVWGLWPDAPFTVLGIHCCVIQVLAFTKILVGPTVTLNAILFYACDVLNNIFTFYYQYGSIADFHLVFVYLYGWACTGCLENIANQIQAVLSLGNSIQINHLSYMKPFYSSNFEYRHFGIKIGRVVPFLSFYG